MFVAFCDLWWLTRSCRKITILLLIGSVLEQVLRLTVPLVLGRMIDVLSMDDTKAIYNQAGWLTTLFVAASSLAFAVQFFLRHGIVHLIHRVKGNLICDAFDHLLSLPVGFHEMKNTGSKTKIIQNGTEKTVALAQAWAVQGLPVIIHYALAAAVLLFIWRPAGLIVGIVVPLVVGLSVLFYRLGTQHREERHECYEASESLLVESIQSIATIQSFRVEESHSHRVRSIWSRVYQTGFKEMRFADFGYVIRNTAIVCSLATVMYFGFNAVAQGLMTAGTFILVLVISMRMMDALWPLGQIIDETMHNAPSLRRLRELFAITSDVQEAPVALALQQCTGSLVFEGVKFRYPGKTENALDEFSLSVKPNSTVALVGPSGAGKSTVFKLARRFSDPDSGKILLDGYDLRELKLSFRQHIAVVSQEIDVFSGTIAQNIAFGRTDLSQEDIERFARIAHVDEFVQTFPNGYGTLVGERGLRLSGGQRQRLAIARALAADCPIILFDEATSHLDPESEALIQKAMSDLLGSRTIIIIAHRLSTIRHADVIVVMERGRVVEQGTHEILRSVDDGVYRRYLQVHAS